MGSIIWMQTGNPNCHWRQAYEQYEFFAGVGNITKVARAAGYRALRFDLLDNEKPPHRKSNFMDLSSTSGFGLLAIFWLWDLVDVPYINRFANDRISTNASWFEVMGNAVFT